MSGTIQVGFMFRGMDIGTIPDQDNLISQVTGSHLQKGKAGQKDIGRKMKEEENNGIESQTKIQFNLPYLHPIQFN